MITVDRNKLLELIAQKKGVTVQELEESNTNVTAMEVQLYMLAKGKSVVDDITDDNKLQDYATDYFNLKQNPLSKEYGEAISDMKDALGNIETMMGVSDMTPALQQYMDEMEQWQKIVAEQEEEQEELERLEKEEKEKEEQDKERRAIEAKEKEKIEMMRMREEHRAQHRFKQDQLADLRKKYPGVDEIQSAMHIKDIEKAAVKLNDKLAKTPPTDEHYNELKEKAELLSSVGDEARKKSVEFENRNRYTPGDTMRGIVKSVQKLDQHFENIQKKAMDFYAEKPKVVKRTLDELIKERNIEKNEVKKELKPVEPVKKEPVKEKNKGSIGM
jgi:hypothetical protein